MTTYVPERSSFSSAGQDIVIEHAYSAGVRSTSVGAESSDGSLQTAIIFSNPCRVFWLRIGTAPQVELRANSMRVRADSSEFRREFCVLHGAMRKCHATGLCNVDGRTFWESLPKNKWLNSVTIIETRLRPQEFAQFKGTGSLRKAKSCQICVIPLISSLHENCLVGYV